MKHSELKNAVHLDLISAALSGHRGDDQLRIAEVGLQWVATLLRKNADYGSSAWEKPILAPECSASAAIRVRMSDKINRLATLLANDCEPEVAESIDDTLGDLGSYCLLELARPDRTPAESREVSLREDVPQTVFNWQTYGPKGRLPCAKLFDAEGQEHFRVIECDIETGRIRKYREANGATATDANGNPIVIEAKYPAPLRVEFESGGGSVTIENVSSWKINGGAKGEDNPFLSDEYREQLEQEGLGSANADRPIVPTQDYEIKSKPRRAGGEHDGHE